MDESVGTCPECGGTLSYDPISDEVVCDTCDYIQENAM